MKFWGHLACLAAVAGLLFQAVGISQVLADEDLHHAEVAAGECGTSSHDSHCPAGPAHDHCSALCSHFFTALPHSFVTFEMRVPRTISVLAIRQESAPEGFPPGLFIPPRVS